MGHVKFPNVPQTIRKLGKYEPLGRHFTAVLNLIMSLSHTNLKLRIIVRSVGAVAGWLSDVGMTTFHFHYDSIKSSCRTRSLRTPTSVQCALI